MKTVNIILWFLSLFLLTSCIPIEIEEEPALLFELNLGIDTVEVGTQHIDTGAIARRNGVIYNLDVVEHNVDVSSIGTYQITYQLLEFNNVLSITRIVTVVDETPPVIELNPGVDTISIGDDWLDAYVMVYDLSEKEITVIVEGEVITSQVGEYVITYYATDESGNTSSVMRYVNVIDIT